MIKWNIKSKISDFLGLKDFPNLQKNVIELNDIHELKKIFGWTLDPTFDDPQIYKYEYIEDINQRRLRDAESIGTVVRNIKAGTYVEIGTGIGHSTAIIASNSPSSNVYTVNIPAEEFENGGILTTMKLEKDKIGSFYREKNLTNVIQIFANTATWEPKLSQIDFAFIDGSHDTEFVFNDTIKVLKYMKPGSFILWHDFNLSLAYKYEWINSVCSGVEKLFTRDIIKGWIFHIKDSWVGIYQVN